MDDIERTLQFRIIEKGQWAYILWPWDTLDSFLYEALQWGATYRARKPATPGIKFWIELEAGEGTQGEYSQGLFFGRLDWGYALYRRFNATGSHYLTQHGLDGIPKAMWDRAYECGPGEPMGNVLFQFRVQSKKGAFDLSFYDWMQYFVSGRNGHISTLAISIKKT